VPEDFTKLAYIFHYTYGIEYTLEGKPQGINQIGEWSLDKRHYGSDHPPKGLQMPPQGANAPAFWLAKVSLYVLNRYPREQKKKAQHWRTRKQYSTQVTRLPLRGAC